jgi:hypothetical protein
MTDKFEINIDGDPNIVGDEQTELVYQIGRGKEQTLRIDLGTSFNTLKKYFPGMAKPRNSNGLTDQLLLGMIPMKNGLLRPDLLRHSAHNNEHLKEMELGKELLFLLNPEHKRKCDGILVTHHHVDHIGEIRNVREDVPIYQTEISTAGSRFMEEAGTYQDLVTFVTRGEGYSRKEKSRDRPITHVEDLKNMIARFGKNLTAKFLPNDHSVPGSGGYLVTGNVKGEKVSILKTGDFRFHGLTDDSKTMIETAAKAKPLVVIIETTNAKEGDKEVLSEADCKEGLIELVQERDQDFFFTSSPGRNTQTHESAYIASQKRGMTHLISPKMAFYFKLLADTGVQHPFINPNYKPGDDINNLLGENMGVYLAQKKMGRLLKYGHSDEMIGKDYVKWMREFLMPNGKMSKFVHTAHDIHRNQSKYFLNVDSTYDLSELFDIRPNPSNTTFTTLNPDPFDTETGIDRDRWYNWAEKFSDEESMAYHSSGHTDRKGLVWSVKTLAEANPDQTVYFVPVHGEHPEEFAGIIKEAGVKNAEVIIPKRGMKIDVLDLYEKSKR